MWGQLAETKLELTQAHNKIAQLYCELAIKENSLLLMRGHLAIKQEELRNAQLEKAETPSTLRCFNSLEELEAWLALDDTDQMQYCDEFNCIDFALQLQERALADGYILSTEVLPVAFHWANIAVIGDAYYVIEPQDDRILLEVER